MKLLLRLIKEELGYFISTLMVIMIGCFINLYWNSTIIKIMDTIGEHQGVSIKLWILAATGIAASMGINFLVTIISGWTGETMNHNLRMTYTKHFTQLSYQDLEQLNAGTQMSILQNEIAEVSSYLTSHLFSILQSLCSFVITLVFLSQLNPFLLLVTNTPVILIMVYVIFSSKVIGTYSNISQDKKLKMNSFVNTLVNIYPVLHIYDGTSLMCNKYENAVKDWESVVIKEEKIRASLMSLSALMSCIPILLLFLVGGGMVIQQITTIGIVYAFLNLSKNVSGVLMNMPGWIGMFRHFLANMKRIENRLR